MSADSPTHTPIAAATTLGTVRLTVSDLERSRSFYETGLGLRSIEQDDGTLALGVEDRPAMLELRGDATAPPANHRATGLFHFAVLVPSRRDLAHALVRLGQAGWPLTGASDHLVSEAIYLNDPDGNGIEIYRDRERSEWTHSNGQLEMATIPLDLDDVLGELPQGHSEQRLAPARTTIGHVHLQVAELRDIEAFYSGVLGFDVTVRGYPGALFVSAGGYHHHLGLNTWRSLGALPPAPGSLGLQSFEVILPDEASLTAVLDRVSAAGLPTETGDRGTLVRDPSGNGVLLRL